MVGVPMKKPKKKKKKKEPEDPNAPPRPKRNTGLNKPLILSPELSALMDGDLELSRPEIVKRLWAYIKKNDLQDPKDRRFILCDEKLKTIFLVDRVNSFGMNRDLSKHLTKKEGVAAIVNGAQSVKEEPNTAPLMSSNPSNLSTKQSPTVTAETPDDILTPKDELVPSTSLSNITSALPASNTALSTPTLQ
ncbi:SWIB-domain-containing protein [Hesseltinella vesiculosa]|uniref:SWIB-domain-containing protein n=1 Tax=Hesseltinella vesiculosa TaxID=101127 RepID=A0A1X2GXJ6_9FUNG|nr:SWIB-domain-containing protein [Hesseltinella vesiculosa]